jgi:hypothetical protein
MGFAYQAFPRFKHTVLSYPRLALASWWLMLTGIVGRSVSEPLAQAWAGMATVAVAASLLEILAIGLFVWVIGQTWRHSGKRLETYDYYILSALVWFVLQAVYETVYLAATLAVTEREPLLALVATWQGALREMQIHGFALLMILGVSQRIFHHFYGFPAPQRQLSLGALIGLNVAIVGEVCGLVLMRASSPAWAALWYASVLLLAGSVGILVGSWRLFSPAEDPDRSLKFLRVAYVWLFISLAMLVLMPVYQFGLLPWVAPTSSAVQIGFSHAYYGALRHAITVGFISLMIVGVAAKVVPTLNGVDVRRLSPLWAPFFLLNTGCALRVTAQTWTDFTAVSFPLAGVSGLLEVLGLALWGVHLWRIMAGRIRPAVGTPDEEGTALVPGAPIAATHRVGEVLEQDPDLLKVFLAFGFQPLANPLLRRTLARQVTLARACRLLGRDPQALVEALNAARKQPSLRRLALPVLAAGSAPAP